MIGTPLSSRNNSVQGIGIVRTLLIAEVSFWKIASTMQFTIKYSADRGIPVSTAGDQLSLIVVGINQVGRQVPLPAITVVET
jgi:hypothetical protein